MIALCMAAVHAQDAAAEAILKLATTTSTENTGLLKHLLPVFEKKNAVTVRVIAVGTGQALKLGEREWKGDDLSALFVYPAANWVKGEVGLFGQHLVGAFADTGVQGTRLGYDLAPFSSGVGYPDYALFSAEILSKGDLGVLAAGWFDHEWKLDSNRYLRDEDPPAAHSATNK
jgi:hypothetical protein